MSVKSLAPSRSGRARRLAVLMAGALALPLTLVAPPANALMKAHCKPQTGFGHFDPIIRANETPDAATQHHHTFFANEKLTTLANPNAAKYNELVGAATTCQNIDDSAAYWIPTLQFRSNGQPVPIRAMIAYYRSFDHKTTGAAEAVPADMRIVAGNAKATSPQSTKRVNWSCNQNSSRRGPYADAVEANCAAATGTVYLTAHVDFPTCWDGKMNDHSVAGNTADYSDGGGVVNHLAFANGSLCPAGFPRKLPELRQTISWKYQGNGKDIKLSSDQASDPAGRTLHADFWNTWVQTGGAHGGMVGMVQKCVNTTTGSSTMCG